MCIEGFQENEVHFVSLILFFLLRLVLESPVQSGLLPKFEKTETRTSCDQLMDQKKLHKTDVDQFWTGYICYINR